MQQQNSTGAELADGSGVSVPMTKKQLMSAINLQAANQTSPGGVSPSSQLAQLAQNAQLAQQGLIGLNASGQPKKLSRKKQQALLLQQAGLAMTNPGQTVVYYNRKSGFRSNI